MKKENLSLSSLEGVGTRFANLEINKIGHNRFIINYELEGNLENTKDITR